MTIIININYLILKKVYSQVSTSFHLRNLSLAKITQEFFLK